MSLHPASPTSPVDDFTGQVAPMNTCVAEGHPKGLTTITRDQPIGRLGGPDEVVTALLDDRACPSQRLRHDSNVRPSV